MQIDPNTVSPNEAGVVRIYAIDLAPADTLAFCEPKPDQNGDADWPLKAALGVTHLDEDFVEVFDVATLEQIGLSGYLVMGNGIAEADVAPYKDMLDRLQGHVAIVFSAAFGGVEAQLTPQSPLRYIAAFREENAPVTFKPLPDESAKRTDAPPAKKKPSDAAMSGRVATIALLVMAFLVWLMIRIAG